MKYQPVGVNLIHKDRPGIPYGALSHYEILHPTKGMLGRFMLARNEAGDKTWVFAPSPGFTIDADADPECSELHEVYLSLGVLESGARL